MFIITSSKQLVLFDVLQQKKIGNYFNDLTLLYQKDKLADEKQLTCVVSGNDGLFVAVGGASGVCMCYDHEWLVFVNFM